MELYLILWVCFLVASVLLFFYFYLIDTYDYWLSNRVNEIGRPIPGFGNVYSLFTLRESLSQLLHGMYVHEFPNGNSSMVAFFFLRRPALLLRQPKLIRRVLVTQGHYFRPFALPNESTDPLLNGSSIFVGCNSLERWRYKVRFTNNRLEDVLRGMKKLCISTREVCENFLEGSAGDIDSYHEFEPHHWLTFHSSLVMLRFGMGERNTRSDMAMQMKRVGRRLSKFIEDPRRITQHIYTRYASIIAKVLGKFRQDLSSIVPKKTEELFREAVISYLNTYDNPDSLHQNCLLNWMHIDEEEKRPLLDDETIMQQLFAFHLEVYLVNTVIGSYVLFHLAWNPNIQARLRRSIGRIIKKPDGMKRVTYDDLSNMPYLDAVINETMRMHPVLGAVERVCRQHIVLSGSDDQKVVLQPNDLVFISTQGLHLDSHFWESANQFNPDRFLTNDRKRLRNDLPLVPFVGLHTSQACGFHWVSLRLLLISMVRGFEFTRSTTTARFPKLSHKSFVTTAQDGLWIKIKRHKRSIPQQKKESKEVKEVGI